MIRRVQVLQPEELIGTIEDFTRQMPELYQCVLNAMNHPMKSYTRSSRSKKPMIY